MTAISPLQSIHKKGIFGDHQKKMRPNLITTCDLIYNYTKQKKQNVVFQEFVDYIKNDIYIKIIDE